jgi:DNA polymerase-3 subunit gamma/tau
VRLAGYRSAMAYEPLHHKYRPQTFAQLVGQDAIATTLSNALHQRRIAPAYLLCGPRGTGKTSSARILAKSLNCLSQEHPTPEPCGVCETCRSIASGSALDFIEIDAASNTGVDNIRELIERAQFAPVQCRYKVYVIDECHMLSTAAFNALLKTLEEPPSNVVFVLATTDPQRVLPTIISRCQRFDYRRIPLEPMVAHLRAIADKEEINIDDDALRLVAQISQGGLRDAQSLLDQLSLLEPPIKSEAVWDLVGAVPERDLLALVQGIVNDDSTAMLDQARKLMDRGREPLIVLQNLAGFYRDLLIAKTAGHRQDLVAVTPPTWADMQSLVQGLDTRVLLLGQQQLRSAEVQVKNTTQPRLWLEVALLGLLPSTLASLAGGPGGLTNGGVSSRPPGQSPAGLSSSVSRQAAPTSPPQPAASSPVSTPPPTKPATDPLTNTSQASPDAVAPAPEATVPSEQSVPPPPSEAATPPPPIEPPATDSSNTGEAPLDPQLAKLWQQILAVLQPFGTRALMKQQGCLLYFDGTVARIGISSRPLFKMAQGRVANVEEAFQQVTQQRVTVSLEVLPDPKPEEPAPDISAASNGATGPLPQVVPMPDIPAPPPPPPSEPASDSVSVESPAVFPAEPMVVNPALPAIESDLERAVKNFAQFFNGQVVDMSDEADDSSDQKPTPSKAASKQPSHPDKDVPF